MRPSQVACDYYRTLGVKYGATKTEIRTAFLGLAKTHHPDARGDVRMFQAITEAHEVLSHDVRRSAYDRSIGAYKVKPQRTVITRPVGTVAHDFDMWRQWHYGVHDREATRQVNKHETPTSAFFQRKLHRTIAERKEFQELTSIQDEKDAIVRRLRDKRALRQRGHKHETSCVIS